MTVMTATRPARVELVTATMPEALASAWTAIRKRHRGVPVATVQVAPGRGLSVDWTKHGIGFSATSVPDHTADVYAQAIAQLARALESWQAPRRARAESYNGVTAHCGCPRTIRLRSQHGAEELAEQPIVCTVCGKPFMPDVASGALRRLAAKVDEHPTEYAREVARARSGNRSIRR